VNENRKEGAGVDAEASGGGIGAGSADGNDSKTEPAVVCGGFCQELKLSRVLISPTNLRYDCERSGVSDR
jgi:hypothetical protein